MTKNSCPDFFEYPLSDIFFGYFLFFLFFFIRFVLKELIQTEKDYVKSLGEVVEVSISDC